MPIATTPTENSIVVEIVAASPVPMTLDPPTAAPTNPAPPSGQRSSRRQHISVRRIATAILRIASGHQAQRAKSAHFLVSG